MCVRELIFQSLHAVDRFTKRQCVTKQRDKACGLDINQILLSGLNWHFSFGWFRI